MPVPTLTEPRRILDIGTGTGLIAIMLAQRCNAEIVAIEPDGNHLFSALRMLTFADGRNVSRLKIQPCRIIGPDEKFDLIVSNPPYFSDSLKNPDPRKSLQGIMIP